MSPFDKQIHADEFKLRILMTDGCNKSCGFCLNDFQPKPKNEPTFINRTFVYPAIRAYANLFRDRYPLQVYFSGGEPTLHPNLVELVEWAKGYDCRVTLNTNGSFSNELEAQLGSVDCMHFGVYSVDENLAHRIQRMKGTVQCVYSQRFPYVDFQFLSFYLDYGLPIKVFGDLFEDPAGYAAFAEKVVHQFPGADLQFRFIGLQENRGIGCNNCDRYCVTLKGAWIFPDGTTSHCPQKCKGEVYDPSYSQWPEVLQKIEQLHKSQPKES